MDPKTAMVTEKGGLKLTKAEDGKYTAEVDYEQNVILVSKLVSHDPIEEAIKMPAEAKTVALTMKKTKVSNLTNY